MKQYFTLNRKAFSILELLLAIMLSVLVILCASAAIRSMASNKLIVEKNSRLFNQVELLLDSIANDLSNLYIAKGEDVQHFSLYNSGSENEYCDRLRFYRIADPDSQDGYSCINEIEYGLLANYDQDGHVGRRVAVVNDISAGNKKGKVFVMAEGIKSLKFELYNGSSWYAMAESNEVPAIVKVTIELNGPLWNKQDGIIIRNIPVYPQVYLSELKEQETP